MAVNDNIRTGDANRDPLTGAPGAHPVGTGVGAVGGAAAGAAIGTAAGPVGTLVGGAIGAVVGGLAGKATAESIDPTAEDAYWRGNYSSRPYVDRSSSYDDYAPAYTYGSQMRSQYSGRQWDDVETNLRTDWESRNGSATGSTWEKMKAAVRHGWDRMTDDNSSGRSSY